MANIGLVDSEIGSADLKTVEGNTCINLKPQHDEFAESNERSILRLAQGQLLNNGRLKTEQAA